MIPSRSNARPLAGFGLATSVAVAVVPVYRLINFWLPIPAGLGTYLSLR